MIIAQGVGLLDIVVVLIYLLVIAYLGWLGYRRTRTAADYLVAGRSAHPVIMALSYGATFISTSAIVGFGGVAGLFGMNLLWLAFLNIAVGIFIAFIFLGEPTRRLGHRLGAHTFPELLGKRFNSKAIHVLAGSVIFLFMPLYASAVLSGGSKFTAVQFGVDYDVALLIFSVITAAYVIAGGIKAVMYTDTLQGIIMLAGMIVLIVFTYASVGGVVTGHQHLTDLAPMVPESLQKIGHQGWTAMPRFGFGSHDYDLWWRIISAIILGVGIGVLAQPQLITRFMMVRSKRELNRAVPIGAFFILVMVAVPYVTGSLSNSYFTHHGPVLTGTVTKILDAQQNQVLVQLPPETPGSNSPSPASPGGGGGREGVAPGSNPAPGSSPSSTNASAVPPAKPKMVPLLLDDNNGPAQIGQTRSGRSIAITYAKGDPEQIMPIYINTALPRWFGLLFFLTLLSAAMSTLSSQFHALGSSAGRDLYEQLAPRSATSDQTPSIKVVRIAIILGLLAAVTISHYIRNEFVIARFTAIFFGLCAAAFMPAYLGGLFWKRMTAPGAIASMIVGLSVSIAWLLLVKEREASALGLVQLLTGGGKSILAGYPNWPEVDPILIALPLSMLTAIIVSLLTTPPSTQHLENCFGSTSASSSKR